MTVSVFPSTGRIDDDGHSMKIIQFTKKSFLIAIVAFGCIFSSAYALYNEYQTSWLKEEYNEKDVLLTSFWKERIINYNKKSVADFKSFIIAMQYPQDKIFENQMNELFQNAITHKIEYQSFYNILKKFPLLYFRAINQAEHLIPEKQYEDINPVIERSDLEKIQHYIKHKDLSVSLDVLVFYNIIFLLHLMQESHIDMPWVLN